MGSALIQGLRRQGVPGARLVVADADPKACARARRRFQARIVKSNLDVARRADVIILAVKPQQFPEVAAQLAQGLQQHPLVISIAAGMTLRWLGGRLPGVALARVMPNLPATVGCGFSALTFNARASARHRAITAALFQAVGAVVQVPERHFDAVTAVSGSGPAYVFFLVDAWQRAAQALGLPEAVASQAIRHTLKGSARLLDASPDDAAALMAKVASKGGTTEAALRVLTVRRVSASLVEAMTAAARRSRTLSWS